jgi:hypothetical protein
LGKNFSSAALGVAIQNAMAVSELLPVKAIKRPHRRWFWQRYTGIRFFIIFERHREPR